MDLAPLAPDPDQRTGLAANESMAAVRQRLVDATLFALAAFGTPAVLASTLRAVDVGWHNVLLMHLCVYFLLMACLFYRRRIPYLFKVWLVLGLGFLTAFNGLWAWGLLGTGMLAFSTVTTLAALFFGLRGGTAMALISLAAAAVIGFLVVTGRLAFSFDQTIYSLSPITWVTALAVYGVLMAIVLMAIGRILAALTQSIEGLDDHSRRLETANIQLIREMGGKEQALRALDFSERKYRGILESIDEGYYEVDLEGRLTFMNPALVQIYGYPPDELKGLDYRQYIGPGEQERVVREFGKVLETGMPNRIARYAIIRKDGEKRILEASIYLSNDSWGRPEGFRGVVRDVTSQVEAEQEKALLEEQLRQAQKWEAVGTLAGGVAHDFNNLLMGIQGNVSLMLLNSDPDGPDHDNLKTMEACVKDATGLTRQLLGYAQGGKYEVKPTDLNFIVKKTADMFGRAKKEVEIIFQLHSTWIVDADQSQMQQVFLNLLVNAWQAMPGGGVITLSTRNQTLGKNSRAPGDIPPGDYVRIRVQDTGHGMDEHTISRVFDPFFTTKEKVRGSGLGLASAYGIVKNHGGEITVTSQPEKGAVFEVILPARASLAPSRDMDESREAARGTETVLLVDDEQIVLETTRQMLQAQGYQVLAAASGRAALDLFQKHHDQVSLAVLDMVMPGMSGAEVLAGLQQIKPGLPVLMSSGYSLDPDAARLMKQGCSGFIQKPYSLEQLSTKLREILDLSSTPLHSEGLTQ